MSEAVSYYEQWVNGAELRVAQLAAGACPLAAPHPSEDHGSTDGELIELSLPAHDNVELALPRLDAAALSPIRHVLLHGSMATADTCDFSDVDIAVFVDDLNAYSAPQHRAAVHELRRLLDSAFRFDSLMHHGLMFASASALLAYDQRFLPVDTLARARVLYGPQTLQLRMARSDTERFRSTLLACAASLRGHIASLDFLSDDYRLKNFLSGALLMPARILAAHGTHVYKRESFALAKSLFAPQQWEFIVRCEALRALWQRTPAPLPQRALPSAAHPHLRQIIGRRLAPHVNVRRFSQTMIEGLVQSAHRFLDRLEEVA